MSDTSLGQQRQVPLILLTNLALVPLESIVYFPPPDKEIHLLRKVGFALLMNYQTYPIAGWLTVIAGWQGCDFVYSF